MLTDFDEIFIIYITNINQQSIQIFITGSDKKVVKNDLYYLLRDFDQLSDKPSNFSKQVKPTDSILKKLFYFKGCVNTFVRVLIYFYN